MRMLGSITLCRGFLLIAVCLSMQMKSAQAEGSYDYHHKSPLALGRGFDPKSPLRVYAIPCIVSKGRENIDTSGAANIEIKTSIVRSQEEYYRETGFSANLDAHFQFFSGGASYSNSKTFSSSEDALTWIVKAEIIFGRYRLKEPSLSEHANKILAKAAQFTAMCGPEFGAQETRGARALVVFNARNLTTETKQKLEASIYAAYSSPGASVNAGTQYRESVGEIRKTAILNHSFITAGGPGPEVLRSMIVDVEDPIRLRDGLANYVVNITDKNAVPLHFQTASFAQFGATLLGEMLANRDNVLIQMNYRYQDLQAVVDRIYSFIRPDDAVNSYLRTYVSEAERARLEKIASKYAERTTSIYNQARACLQDEKACVVPEVTDIERVEFPKIPGIPEPLIVVQCNWPYIYDERSPPVDTFVVGEGGVLIGFPEPSLVKQVTFEYFGDKETSRVFDLFQTTRITSAERALMDKTKGFYKPGTFTDEELVVMARLNAWQPHFFCSNKVDLDQARKFKQFAAFKVKQRFKTTPINIQVIDIFDRTRNIELNWEN